MNQTAKINQQKREWYHRNKEAVLEQQKHSARKKQTQQEWYHRNKVKCATKDKQWTKDNPTARKLIMIRHKIKNNPNREWADGT